MDKFSDYIKQRYKNPIEPVGKWDIVLFMGKYDPINKDEHERIGQFIRNIIRNDTYKDLFSKNVEIGLIFDDKADDEIFADKNYMLSTQEKEFITGKLFGLRCFPVNYRQLKWLMLPVPDKNKLPFNENNSFQEMFAPALDDIKKNFDGVNILIVVNPKEMEGLADLDAVTTQFEDDNVKIGFVTWKSSDKEKVQILGNVPISGDMIKAVCLLDHYRPDPEDLKSFCFKYNLGEYLEHIKSIHFRVGGEKYLEAFMLLFPEVVIYDFHEENKEDNYRVIMEIIKKMYLKDEYLDTSITLTSGPEITNNSTVEDTEDTGDEPDLEEDVSAEEELPDLEI